MGNSRQSKVGLPPGSIVFTGIQKVENQLYTLLIYDEQQCDYVSAKNWEECKALIESYPNKKIWLDIIGLHDTETIELIGTYFYWHKLAIEDVVSVRQRAKVEEHDQHLYVVARMLRWLDNQRIDDEQLSIFLHKNVVVTFQEKSGDVFDSLRSRLLEGKGLIRSRGIDYFLYALLDSVVDQYFVIVERLGDKLEYMEELVIDENPRFELSDLHQLKRELMKLRRAVYPMRELTNNMTKTDETIFESGTKYFLRDLHDHCIQVIDNIEIQRDVATGLMDVYINTVSNRMNETMKVLTIIATIFIPLTFIAGVYGMNFDVMPELHNPYGYYAVWILMIVIAIVMLIWFRRKGWLKWKN